MKFICQLLENRHLFRSGVELVMRQGDVLLCGERREATDAYERNQAKQSDHELMGFHSGTSG